MAYTSRRTGSARSVGNRRTLKYYAVSTTECIAARSAAGARMDAQALGLTLTGDVLNGPLATVHDRRFPTTPTKTPPPKVPGPKPVPTTNDYTAEVTALLGATEKAATVFANLASLQASPSIGNGGTVNLTGDAGVLAKMQAGGHVQLADGTTAWYDGAAWATGMQADAPDVVDEVEVDVPTPKRKTRKKTVSRKRRK